MSKTVNDTFYLDVDYMEWKSVSLSFEEGTKTVLLPKQRE